MYSHGSSANGWFVRKLVVARAVVCMQCCVVLCPTKKVLLFMNTCPRKRALVPCNDRNRRIGAQTLVWYPSVGTGTSTYQLQDYVADGAISYCLNVRCLLRCWLCICANSWSIRPSPLLPRFVYATSVHNWLHLEYTWLSLRFPACLYNLGLELNPRTSAGGGNSAGAVNAACVGADTNCGAALFFLLSFSHSFHA